MKNINRIKLLILAILITFTACDTVDFGDTNVDPNSPSNATTSALFTNAEKTVGDNLEATTANLYVQYLSNGQYPEESLYQTLNWSFNGYYAALTDLQKVIELNTNESTKVAAQAYGSNANQIAAAIILRVYFFHQMTDRWGMIPYSEALQGLENPFPKYESEQAIYTGLFGELDSALSMIDSGNGPTGDIILNGDMSRWITFANTIKLVMALRLSKADPVTGKGKFLEAMSGAISSNTENIQYTYLTEDTNDNPWQDNFESRRDYLLSETFANALIGSGTASAPEDPRTSKYFETANNYPTMYRGAPYGILNGTPDDWSFITSDIIFKSDAPLMIYTYSEVLFARSEAAALGWTTENASSLYENAITASMDQWGVSSSAANTYIAGNPYSELNDIAFEKWKSLFLQGYNSWAEWRRHKAMGYGVPLTAPADLLSNATDIPDRHAYSATAGDLNKENYDAAIAAQGPDALNTILWTNQ